MFEELINARNADLRASSQTITHRMEWAELSRLDSLERALKAVKGRLHMLPTLKTEAN
ncbi:MAG: hypothetical protein AB7J35_19355 [Dehalococcoidia bacterium]